MAHPPRIAVSVLSLLPFSLGLRGLDRSVTIAKQCGMGLQLAPLRGWDEGNTLSLRRDIQIEAYEGPFINYPGWFATVVCAIRQADPGLLLGKVIFQPSTDKLLNAIERRCPSAYAVDMPERGNYVMEVSPVNSTQMWKYFEHDVALDLYHVWEYRKGYGRIGKESSNIDLFIQQLFRQNRVRLIHFQTRKRSTLDDFLMNTDVHLTSALRCAAEHQCIAPVVIELPPWFLWPKPEVTLRAVAERIRDIYDNQPNF